ncbi:MAG: enoyl-CoA hydratase/isomerase family protein [Nitrososphaeraceae archaeon]
MKSLVIEKHRDILIVKINRPEVLNALNFDVVKEFSILFNTESIMNKVKCIIITGAGEKSFCSGGDLKFVAEMTPIEAEQYASFVHNLLNKIENLDKPVIAAINGFALGGGCQLALACDIRIASSNAKIGQTEVKVGIPPGWGGTQRLSRLVGLSKSKELIYTGKIISAHEAKQIGLVNDVVSINSNQKIKKQDNAYTIVLNKKLINECILFAESISENNNHYYAVQISKKLINKARDVNIESGLVLEKYGCSLCFNNIDKQKMKNLLS